MAEHQESEEIRKLKLELKTREREAWYGVLRVLFGTMAVGIAAAVFPFASQFAESYFAASIENARRDAEIEIAERRHELEVANLTEARKLNERNYFEEISNEARSDDIATRIIIAEFFSFLAQAEEERKRWLEFRDHLYKQQEELNKRREAALAAATDEAASEASRKAAEAVLEQIRNLESPGSSPSHREVNKVVVTATDDVPIERLRAMHQTRGFSDVGFHFLVRSDGSIELGRDISRAPAISQNNNIGSVGIGVSCKNYRELFRSGNSSEYCIFSDAQANSLRGLISNLMVEYGIEEGKVFRTSDLKTGKRNLIDDETWEKILE